jgi:hypothetical protein
MHRELLTHVYISNLPLFSPQASATTGAALRVGAGAVDHLNTVVTDMSAHAREQNPNESRDCWSRQRRLRLRDGRRDFAQRDVMEYQPAGVAVIPA